MFYADVGRIWLRAVSCALGEHSHEKLHRNIPVEQARNDDVVSGPKQEPLGNFSGDPVSAARTALVQLLLFELVALTDLLLDIGVVFVNDQIDGKA